MLNTTQEQPRDAAQVQVPLLEIAKAVAVIEARKQAEALEAANTVVLADGLQQVKASCTADELWAEILRLRAQAEQDQLARAAKQRRHLMGYAGAALALLAAAFALTLKMTVYNPRWQAQQQQHLFLQDLALTRGPHPEYHIVVAPYGNIGHNSFWGQYPKYPIMAVPEGYVIHIGNEAPAIWPWQPYTTFSFLRVTFLPAQDLMDEDNAYVVHHGVCYHRGWVAAYDVNSVLHHHHFTFFRNFQVTPEVAQYAGTQDFVPLTIPFGSLLQQHAVESGLIGSTMISNVPEGQNLKLDQYAWEKY